MVQKIKDIGTWWPSYLVLSAIVSIVVTTVWKGYAEDRINDQIDAKLIAVKQAVEYNKQSNESVLIDVIEIKALLYEMSTEDQRKRSKARVKFLIKEKNKESN